jgi:hypothetical protein
LNKFKLSEWLKDILQILFSDAEVNVSNVEAMKRDRVMIATLSLGIAGLTILLCLSELCDNGDPKELLSGHLYCEWDRIFALELHIAYTGETLASRPTPAVDYLPFGTAADSIFDNLSLIDRTNLFEKLDQLFGAQTSCKLLNKDSSPITFVLGELGFWSLALDSLSGAWRASTFAVSVSMTAVIVITSRPPRRTIVSLVFRGSRTPTMVVLVTLRSSSIIISISATTLAPAASVASVSAAMVAPRTLHLLVSFSAVFSVTAAVSSLAVSIPIAGAITVAILLSALRAVAPMAVFAVAWRIFDIVGGGGVEKSLNIES